ncbi:MAG: hypothetical protein D6698_17625 [Gammaproteobacteria bacterium]|nr:MAG: hypothetical protein D6698_17625 [Gammaproteobacteria bacterium]
MIVRNIMQRLLFLAVSSFYIANCPAGEKVDYDTLTSLLAYGTSKDIPPEEATGVAPLILRLHALPDLHHRDCIPETDSPCGNIYYLSVATYDEFPEAAVFRLPLSGEVLSVELLPTDKDQTDTARLSIEWQNVSRFVHARNPEIPLQRRTMTVRVTPTDLQVESGR